MIDAVVTAYAERPESLATTLASLVAQGTNLRRIIVIDDCSPTPVVIPEHVRDTVTLVRLSENQGIAAARNHGASLSDAEYLLFINCDVAIPAGWCETASDLMTKNAKAGVLGGPIVPRVGPVVLRRWRLRFLENPEQRENTLREVSWLTGHAVIVRRDVFVRIAGYDTRYSQSGEDHDLCIRIGAKGYSVHHVPNLASESYENPSIGLFARKMLRHSGWDLRGASREGSIDVRPVRLIPAIGSIARMLVNLTGRDIVKGRWCFLAIDLAVVCRAIIIVSVYHRRWRNERLHQSSPVGVNRNA